MNSRLAAQPASTDVKSTKADKKKNPRCVLLAGSARGGTSWALKVLDSHPAVHGSHEPFYQLNKEQALSNLYDRIKADRGTTADIAILTQQLTKASIETNKPPFLHKKIRRTPAWMRYGLWIGARAFSTLASAFKYLSAGTLNEKHCNFIKNLPFPLLDRILKTIHADALVMLRHSCGVVSSWLRGIRMGVMPGNSAESNKVWSRCQKYLVLMGFCEAELQKMSPAGILALNRLVDKTLFGQYARSPHMKSRTMVCCELVRTLLQKWSKVCDWLHLPFDSSVEAFLTQSSNPACDIRRLMGKIRLFLCPTRRKITGRAMA